MKNSPDDADLSPGQVPTDGFVSNYPRGETAVELTPKHGVGWGSLGAAIEMIRSEMKTYALSALLCFALMIVSLIPQGLLGLDPFYHGSNFPSSYWVGFGIGQFSAIIAHVLYFALACLGVRHAQGFKPVFSDLLRPFQRPGKLAFAVLMTVTGQALPVLVVHFGIRRFGFYQETAPMSFGLTAIVSILYGGLLNLAGLKMLFSDLSPVLDLRLTISALGWDSFSFGLLMVVAYCASLSGLGLLLVGILFTFPIQTNVLALRYVDCFDNASEI